MSAASGDFSPRLLENAGEEAQQSSRSRPTERGRRTVGGLPSARPTQRGTIVGAPRKTVLKSKDEFPGRFQRCRDSCRRCCGCIKANFIRCYLFTMLDNMVRRRYILRYAALECLIYLPTAFFFFNYKPVTSLGCCRQWTFILVTGFKGVLSSSGIVGAAMRSVKLMRLYLLLVLGNFAIAWPIFEPLWRSLCTCESFAESMLPDSEASRQCHVAYAFESQSWCHAFEPQSDPEFGCSAPSLLREGTCLNLQGDYCPEAEGAAYCWHEIAPAPLAVLLHIFRQPWWSKPHAMIPGSGRRLQGRSRQTGEASASTGSESVLSDQPAPPAFVLFDLPAPPAVRPCGEQSAAPFLFNVSEPGIVWEATTRCYQRPIQEAIYDEIVEAMQELQGGRSHDVHWDSVLRREVRTCSGDKVCGGMRLSVANPSQNTYRFEVCRYNLPAVPTYSARHLKCNLCLEGAVANCSSSTETSAAICHYDALSLHDLNSPVRPRPWSVDLDEIKVQRHRNVASMDCQRQLRECRQNTTVFLHKFGGGREMLLPDPVDSQACRIVLNIMMIAVVLVNACSVPMVVVVAKFIASRCGDAMEVENQFEVEFSDESSGDDFDAITSGQVCEFFQTSTFAGTFTNGQPRPSNQLAPSSKSDPRFSLGGLPPIEPDVGVGRFSRLSLPQASPRGRQSGVVPSDWGGSFDAARSVFGDSDFPETFSASDGTGTQPVGGRWGNRKSGRRSTRRSRADRTSASSSQGSRAPSGEDNAVDAAAGPSGESTPSSAEEPPAEGQRGWWPGWFGRNEARSVQPDSGNTKS